MRASGMVGCVGIAVAAINVGIIRTLRIGLIRPRGGSPIKRVVMALGITVNDFYVFMS